ncbi:MAG TPA: endo alpha-1,4 polygalactosaminidase [Terriglobia bacterium]|nr:endo alpha-1,4 polygalactosaminidase [Terriglobia bacterium]
MKRILFFGPLVPILLILYMLSPWSEQHVRWAAYYSGIQPEDAFYGFKLLILDRDDHPPIASLQKGRTLLGYISVGEAEKARGYFDRLQKQGLLVAENVNWPGSFYVDVRSPQWPEEIKTLVRHVVNQGFNGVFLDTVDDAEYLENRDPDSCRGMKDAMAQLILDVRREFPDISIAVNRGYSILPQIDTSIDYVLGESVRAGYDFAAKTYRRIPEEQYLEQVETLKAAKRRNPKLTILTLDYWSPDDAKGISRIYQEQRDNGFSPYVATLKLDELIQEPAR